MFKKTVKSAKSSVQVAGWCAAPFRGKATENVVPWPSWLSTRSVLPWPWAMRPGMRTARQALHEGERNDGKMPLWAGKLQLNRPLFIGHRGDHQASRRSAVIRCVNLQKQQHSFTRYCYSRYAYRTVYRKRYGTPLASRAVVHPCFHNLLHGCGAPLTGYHSLSPLRWRPHWCGTCPRWC